MHDIHNFVWFLIIGGAAGWLASMLVSGGGMGILADIIVGIFGAFLGSVLVDFFGITVWGFWGAFLVWVLGSVLLLIIFKAVRGKPRQ